MISFVLLNWHPESGVFSYIFMYYQDMTTENDQLDNTNRTGSPV